MIFKQLNEWLFDGANSDKNKPIEKKESIVENKYLNEKMVTMLDGSKKYHHELKFGDKFKHRGEIYEVVGTGAGGHLTKKEKDGSLHHTFSKDFDKDFKHNEYDTNKKAEKGDMVTFEYNGRKLEREVEQDHENGAVVRINKSDNLVLVKHGFYQYTGKKSSVVKLDLNCEPESEKKVFSEYKNVVNTTVVTKGNVVNEDELAIALKEIDNLVGMDEVKEAIRGLINYLNIQKERTKRGLNISKVSLHCVFYGPPGTGKTTVARIIGKIYKSLGYLQKGQVIEIDRAGLVAGFIGQTAIKVDEVINKSLDGILFIDEAYSLSRSDSASDFGVEAIDVLIKRMEDHRDNLAVIVAGYKDEMEDFLDSNPGMKSRFNRYFFFSDYNPIELLEIFNIFCANNNYYLSKEAEIKLLELLKKLYYERNKTFGNGRLVRNIFEKLIEIQANRIVNFNNLTNEMLNTITIEDIDEYLTHNIRTI